MAPFQRILAVFLIPVFLADPVLATGLSESGAVMGDVFGTQAIPAHPDAAFRDPHSRGFTNLLDVYERFLSAYRLRHGEIRGNLEGYRFIHYGYNGLSPENNRITQDPLHPLDVLATSGLWTCQVAIAARFNQGHVSAATLIHQNIAPHFGQLPEYVHKKSEEILNWLAEMRFLPADQRLAVFVYREDEEPLLQDISETAQEDPRGRNIRMLFIRRPKNITFMALATSEGIALRGEGAADIELPWNKVNALLEQKPQRFMNYAEFQHTAAAPNIETFLGSIGFLGYLSSNNFRERLDLFMLQPSDPLVGYLAIGIIILAGIAVVAIGKVGIALPHGKRMNSRATSRMGTIFLDLPYPFLMAIWIFLLPVSQGVQWLGILLASYSLSVGYFWILRFFYYRPWPTYLKRTFIGVFGIWSIMNFLGGVSYIAWLTSYLWEHDLSTFLKQSGLKYSINLWIPTGIICLEAINLYLYKIFYNDSLIHGLFGFNGFRVPLGGTLGKELVALNRSLKRRDIARRAS